MSRFSLILTKVWFSIECKCFRALTLILIEIWLFSRNKLWKNVFVFFVLFFVKVIPQEESKCKNAPFLQWILKDDDVYLQKITASYIWGNSFIVKNIGFLHNMLPPYCVTGLQWVKQHLSYDFVPFAGKYISKSREVRSMSGQTYILHIDEVSVEPITMVIIGSSNGLSLNRHQAFTRIGIDYGASEALENQVWRQVEWYSLTFVQQNLYKYVAWVFFKTFIRIFKRVSPKSVLHLRVNLCPLSSINSY